MTETQRIDCIKKCEHCITDMASFSPHMKCKLADKRIESLDRCPLTTKTVRDDKNDKN